MPGNELKLVAGKAYNLIFGLAFWISYQATKGTELSLIPMSLSSLISIKTLFPNWIGNILNIGDYDSNLFERYIIQFVIHFLFCFVFRLTLGSVLWNIFWTINSTRGQQNAG